MSCRWSGCGATLASSAYGTAPARSSATSSRASCCGPSEPEPMSEGPVRTTRDGAVLEVMLDRPPANAIDAATSRRMGEAFVGFRDDPALRVAIITGGGEKFFSAGWDLKAAAAGEPPDVDYGVGGFGGMQQLPGLNKPVIAAVNGMAVGGGLELAISADIVIAVEHARFALPEIKSGTLADA